MQNTWPISMKFVPVEALSCRASVYTQFTFRAHINTCANSLSQILACRPAYLCVCENIQVVSPYVLAKDRD